MLAQLADERREVDAVELLGVIAEADVEHEAASLGLGGNSVHVRALLRCGLGDVGAGLDIGDCKRHWVRFRVRPELSSTAWVTNER